MHVSGIFSAVVVGLVLGYLGRLIVPGRSNLGMIATLLIGLAAAFVGGYIGNKAGWSFGPLLVVEVVLAAIGVSLVGGGLRSRSKSR
jgi:uncharacterized membrane protein YeaQ/YmgE (transglycosylase-associated protein family)